MKANYAIKTETAKPAASKGEIVAVLGSTAADRAFVTANLAIAARAEGRRVVVVETGAARVAAHRFLAAAPTQHLADVVANTVAAADAVTKGARGVDVLASVGWLPFTKAVCDRLTEAVNALALVYDLVLVDCCARGGPAVRMLAARANTCLLAITPDARRLPQAAELVAALGAIGVREVPVVIDRAQTRDEANAAFASLASLIASAGNGKDVKVRLQADVRRDSLPGTNATWLEPVLVHAPRSDAAEELRKLARTVAQPPPPAPVATQGLSRRLSELFMRARQAAALPVT